MTKPDYCKTEVYENPPCGYTRCLWCTDKDMPLQCAKLNDTSKIHEIEEKNMTMSKITEKNNQMCDQCGEQIEVCEGCGTVGCPECQNYETPYRDDTTIFLCPKCATEAREEWAQERAKIKMNYEFACNEYLRLFCEKHEYDYEDAHKSWAVGDVGGIAEVGDLFLNMTDIRTDIDMDAPEREIVRWYDYCLRLHTIDSTIPTPNYENWLRGCPRKSEEEIVRLEEIHQRVMKAEQALKDAINDTEQS